MGFLQSFRFNKIPGIDGYFVHCLRVGYMIFPIIKPGKHVYSLQMCMVISLHTLQVGIK